MGEALPGSSGGQHSADVNEVVADHAESNPALHSTITFVTATVQSMPPFHHADASFATGSPFLAVSEPALFLLPLTLGAFGGAIGNAYPLHAFFMRRRFVGGREKAGVGSDQVREAS